MDNIYDFGNKYIWLRNLSAIGDKGFALLINDVVSLNRHIEKAKLKQICDFINGDGYNYLSELIEGLPSLPDSGGEG